ncbi:MAG: IPTL-CTERM sorting domain-containing protein [Acidovorax sp.]|nr:MAG: IPTL-CTERM sorting domain-containing protein [Acidovorax sp.]
MRPLGAAAPPLAVFGIAAALFCPLTASAQVALGAAQNFAVLASTAVTNVGATVVTGDVGVSPGASITGFPPGVVVGTLHAASAPAAQAQAALTTAYNTAAGLPCGAPIVGDLGGQILPPGVYCAPTSAGLTGALTLDYQGNPNAVFVFQIGTTLTTAAASSVVAINTGGNTCRGNVNWQVGSSATLGTGTSFAGNILALVSITLTTGVQLAGRALASNGAVTLDTNTITACTVPPPSGSASSIPTLSEWALILLSSMMAMGGWFIIRRRGASAI